MSATVTPTHSTVFTAVRAFILSIIPGYPVIQGRANYVEPIREGVVITPIFQNRLSTNVHAYHDPGADADPVTNPGTETTTQSVQLSIQVDCYGDLAATWAAIIATLWRDEIACEAMGANVQPIDADDPQSLDFISPDDQAYVPRWMTTARVQYNPAIVTPMTFFDQPPPIYFPNTFNKTEWAEGATWSDDQSFETNTIENVAWNEDTIWIDGVPYVRRNRCVPADTL